MEMEARGGGRKSDGANGQDSSRGGGEGGGGGGGDGASDRRRRRGGAASAARDEGRLEKMPPPPAQHLPSPALGEQRPHERWAASEPQQRGKASMGEALASRRWRQHQQGGREAARPSPLLPLAQDEVSIQQYTPLLDPSFEEEWQGQLGRQGSRRANSSGALNPFAPQSAKKAVTAATSASAPHLHKLVVGGPQAGSSGERAPSAKAAGGKGGAAAGGKAGGKRGANVESRPSQASRGLGPNGLQGWGGPRQQQDQLVVQHTSRSALLGDPVGGTGRMEYGSKGGGKRAEASGAVGGTAAATSAGGGGGGGGGRGGGGRRASRTSAIGQGAAGGEGGSLDLPNIADDKHVDEQGHAIYYRHGVRLVETAEINLEALSVRATWTVLLLPYLCLALALFLDFGSDWANHRVPLEAAECTSGGRCVWTVTSTPPLNAFLTVDAMLPPGDETTLYPPLEDSVPPFFYHSIKLGVTVEGQALGEWRTLFQSAPAGDVLTIRCALPTAKGNNNNTNNNKKSKKSKKEGEGEGVFVKAPALEDGVCEKATLLNVFFDTPGALGWYTGYRITLDIGVLDSTGKAGAGAEAKLLPDTRFTLRSERRVYASTLAFVRVGLLATTALVFVYWLLKNYKEGGGKGFGEWIAERQQLTVLLVALFLWQNPLLAVIQWFEIGEDHRLLGSDLVQGLSMQVMWAIWLCLIDGQRFVRRSSIRSSLASNSLREGGGGGAGGAGGRGSEGGGGRGGRWASGVGTNCNGSNTAVNGISGDRGGGGGGGRNIFTSATVAAATLDEAYPQHHPKSDFYLDFIGVKLLYLLLALSVVVMLVFIRHPEALFSNSHTYDKAALERAYVVVSILLGVLTLNWCVWFSKCAVRTGRVLRRFPFMTTRRQQLVYRVMLMNALLLVCVLGWGPIFQLSKLIRFMITHASLNIGLVEASWRGTLRSEEQIFACWARGFRTPVGQLLFLSVVCYVLVFLFLPPLHSVSRKHDRMFIHTEKDLPPREIVRRFKRTRELEPVFCLETAAQLLEVAWQAYYDPRTFKVDDLIAPALMDLSYLGMTMVAFIEDEEMETKCILLRSTDRLVLAFRGTANLSNVKTDLKTGQVPLPNFKPRNRRRVKVGGPRHHTPQRPQQQQQQQQQQQRRRPSQGGREGRSESDVSQSERERGESEMSPLYGGRSRSFSFGNGEGEGDASSHNATDAASHTPLTGGRASSSSSSAAAAAAAAAGGGGAGATAGGHRVGCWEGVGVCFRSAVSFVPVARQAMPMVHRGFLEAYMRVRERVGEALQRELTDPDKPYVPLYITGHSLGAALATLAAFDVCENFDLPDDLTMYTYGSPRVGNWLFNQKLATRCTHHFRVVCDGDLITAIPRFAYRHGGCKVLVDSECYGTFIVAPTIVEDMFGTKATTDLGVHLLSHYRECLEACMEDEHLEMYIAKGFALQERAKAQAGAGAATTSNQGPPRQQQGQGQQLVIQQQQEKQQQQQQQLGGSAGGGGAGGSRFGAARTGAGMGYTEVPDWLKQGRRRREDIDEGD